MPGGGGWVADLLALHRIPQKDLAAALGLDPSAVTRLLRGHRKLKESEEPLVHAFFSRYGAPGRMPPPLLLRALSLRGVELAEVARRSGVPESRLLEIKVGHGEVPSDHEKAHIASAFGQRPETLFAESGAPDNNREVLREGWRNAASPAGMRPTATAVGDDIPVYRALPVLGGGTYSPQFLLAERMEAPASLRGVQGAFGVYVADRSCSPLLLPGDIYFVNPGRPPLVGERVLVRLGDTVALVGILENRDSRPLVEGREFLQSYYLDGGDAVVESIVAILSR